MSFPSHPLRPLAHALRAVLGRAGDPGLWLPFLIVACAKVVLLLALARVDLVPPQLLAPILALLPQAEHRLHYPETVLQLPHIVRCLDLALFLSVDALLQGWAILRVAGAWTGQPLALFPDGRRARRRLVVLLALAAILAAVPFVTLQVMRAVSDRTLATRAALAAGAVVQMLVLAAPAFAVLHDLSLGRSLLASIRLLERLPLALPLAVVLLAALHAPTLVLQDPAIVAGRERDPDWIVLALLGQIPADVCGAVLAAGLAAYFALRTSERRPHHRRSGPLPALAVSLLVLLLGTGCDTQRAREVSRRYGAERCIARAAMWQKDLLAENDTHAQAWGRVGALYDRALRGLDLRLLGQPGGDALAHDLGKLACRALLGRAEAESRSGRPQDARRDYEFLLENATAFRGARRDAMLGLARSEDRAGSWKPAFPTYVRWLQGVRDADWPLHRQGIEVPVYVARRLRARNEQVARTAWVALADSALDAAAGRGELPRAARYARFVVLLEAERWEDAYAALRRCRELHDPQHTDGALVVAEASLLAGGLGRERDALRVLDGLHAERSPFGSQHRVAGWLLAGQIQVRSGDLRAAQRSYQHAEDEARSTVGRSEAMLGLARVHAALGEMDEARRYYGQLRDVYYATPAGLLAPLEEIRLLFQHAGAVEAPSLLPAAAQQYRRVIQQYGTEMPSLIAAQYLSECMGLGGSWERGVAFLDSTANAFEHDARAGSLLVRAARLAAEKLDDDGRAEVLLHRLYTRYPESDLAVLAHALEDSLGLRSTPR